MPWAAIGDNASRSMTKSVLGKSQTMEDFGQKRGRWARSELLSLVVPEPVCKTVFREQIW